MSDVFRQVKSAVRRFFSSNCRQIRQISPVMSDRKSARIFNLKRFRKSYHQTAVDAVLMLYTLHDIAEEYEEVVQGYDVRKPFYQPYQRRIIEVELANMWKQITEVHEMFLNYALEIKLMPPSLLLRREHWDPKLYEFPKILDVTPFLDLSNVQLFYKK